MRIPYPIEEKQMYYVDDFRVLHLAYLNPFRTRAKRRFYCFVDWEMNRRSLRTGCTGEPAGPDDDLQRVPGGKAVRKGQRLLHVIRNHNSGGLPLPAEEEEEG